MRIIEYSPTGRFGLNVSDEIVDTTKHCKFVINIKGDFKYIYDKEVYSILTADDINTQEDILWIRSKIKTDLYYKIGCWGTDNKHYFLASDKYVTLCQLNEENV